MDIRTFCSYIRLGLCTKQHTEQKDVSRWRVLNAGFARMSDCSDRFSESVFLVHRLERSSDQVDSVHAPEFEKAVTDKSSVMLSR